MLSEKKDIGKLKKSEKEHSNNTTAYGSRYFDKSIPKY
jgi:glutamate decarboxylase